MLFIILKHTIKNIRDLRASVIFEVFWKSQVLVTKTCHLRKNKKSENTRLQQSWNHNGNSRNTQEVFCLDEV